MAEVGEVDGRHARLGEDGQRVLSGEAGEVHRRGGVPAARFGQGRVPQRLRRTCSSADRHGAGYTAARLSAVRRCGRRVGTCLWQKGSCMEATHRVAIVVSSGESAQGRCDAGLVGGLDVDRDAADVPGGRASAGNCTAGYCAWRTRGLPGVAFDWRGAGIGCG